jgi:hypothetical protein
MAHVVVAKNRNGATGLTKCLFEKPLANFRNFGAFGREDGYIPARDGDEDGGEGDDA